MIWKKASFKRASNAEKGRGAKNRESSQLVKSAFRTSIPLLIRQVVKKLFPAATTTIQDFGKALELNPTNPLTYLERGVAHFNLGQYDHSLSDYQQYVAQKPMLHEPFSLSLFTQGFVTSLPGGIYESGRGLLVFMTDFIIHPINTGAQVLDSLVILKDLVKSEEWKTCAKVLAPEIYELVTNWDAIDSYERGKLAGYAFGKYGADILLPGAVTKAGLKGTRELSSVCKNLKLADKTLLLESVNEVKNAAKIGQIVELEKQVSTWLGERTRFIHNEAGDSVFLSKDGVRRVRFDINNPTPHQNPHAHVEVKINDKWVKSGPIYPNDVPHN